MLASVLLSLSVPVTASGVLWSSGLSLLTLVAAVCCYGTSRFLRSHHLSLIAMVVGVSCHNVMGEGDDVAIKSGPVGLGDR